MKVALLCLSLVAVSLTACTTLENRRDMYCGYGKVCGPYTKMLGKCGKVVETKEKTVVVTTSTSDYKSVK